MSPRIRDRFSSYCVPGIIDPICNDSAGWFLPVCDHVVIKAVLDVSLERSIYTNIQHLQCRRTACNNELTPGPNVC